MPPPIFSVPTEVTIPARPSPAWRSVVFTPAISAASRAVANDGVQRAAEILVDVGRPAHGFRQHGAIGAPDAGAAAASAAVDSQKKKLALAHGRHTSKPQLRL